MNLLARLLHDERGATAAEFVMVVPILLIFIFGVLDAGWYAWQISLAGKAVQAGARIAVVTDPVATGLLTEGYVGKTVGSTVLTQGDVIPAAALSTMSCTAAASACTCSGSCPSDLTRNIDNFQRIADRMQALNPYIQDSNITIEYRGSGLGYAGDPVGMEIAPMTTVRVSGMQYSPLMGLVLGATVPMPTSAHTLTMEDGQGAASN